MSTTIKKVLLIDDDPDDCLFFTEQFALIDPLIKVVSTTDAKQLFIYARKLQPDILFLDIDMPRLNGFQCLEELKKDDALKNLPVVMYSSSVQPKDIEKAYLYGANLYVTKPSSLEEINRTLTAILQLNWMSPTAITADHFPNGKYKRFTLPM